MTRIEFAHAARSWIHTPFRRQGYTRSGCDCFGLIAGVALSLGLPGWSAWLSVPEYHNYPARPDWRLVTRCCNQFLVEIDPRRATVADVLLMRFSEPIYFALLTEHSPPYIIHALSRERRVVEHGLDANWRTHIARAYAIPGIE